MSNLDIKLDRLLGTRILSESTILRTYEELMQEAKSRLNSIIPKLYFKPDYYSYSEESQIDQIYIEWYLTNKNLNADILLDCIEDIVGSSKIISSNSEHQNRIYPEVSIDSSEAMISGDTRYFRDIVYLESHLYGFREYDWPILNLGFYLI